jgi:uncharacterized protein (DUF58 family)
VALLDRLLPWRSRVDASHIDTEPERAEDLLARVRAIELKARRLVDANFLGEYHSVFRGLGIEFDELRPYVPGDDVRAMDWHTYARTRVPMIRTYREDRDLTVLFAIDASASQREGADAQSKSELVAELCAVLALAAVRNNDRVGLLLFASEPERYVRPASGARHVLRVVREVLTVQPESSGTDVGVALSYLTGIHQRRATLFLLSDFLTDGYERSLRAAARRFQIVAIRVRDPIDERLPDVGLIRVKDAETGAEVVADTSSPAVRDAYAARVRQLDRARERLFGELGIDEIPVAVGEDYVGALLRFFKRKSASVA